MRSMALVAFGEPLVPMTLDVPKPGPGEVLVKVLACGLCRTDLKIIAGHMTFSRTQRLPHIPGHEVSGEVVATGSGVSTPIGQRVVVFNYWGCGRCPHCVAGEENLCVALRGWVGFTTPGGFQEYLVVPSDYVLPVPPTVSPIASAAMSCALGTGYHAVVTRGRVTTGDVVAILGVGGVGLHALQCARAAGARTVAIDVSEAKLEAARGIGADVALLASAAIRHLRELPGGRGADLVIDCVGTENSTSEAIALARRGGRIVQVGYTTDEHHYPTLATDAVTLRELTIIGSRYITRPELTRAIDLVARGMVRPVISEVMDLSEANAALERIRADAAFGRIVLKVA